MQKPFKWYKTEEAQPTRTETCLCLNNWVGIPKLIDYFVATFTYNKEESTWTVDDSEITAPDYWSHIPEPSV